MSLPREKRSRGLNEVSALDARASGTLVSAWLPPLRPRRIRHFAETSAALAEEDRLFERVVRGESEAEASLWTAERALVAPRATRRAAGFDQAAQASAERGWPVHLRASGGCVVPQGPGILNLTLVRVSPPNSHDPASIYRALTDLVGGVVAGLGTVSLGTVAGSFCDGKYNVAVDGRKLAGTAQRWKRRVGASDTYAVLAHAVILCAADIVGSCAAIDAFRSAIGDGPPLDPSSHVNLDCLLRGVTDAEDYLATQLARRCGFG